MQVSKCEKFGYGVLVSQISTTQPGMRALHATGLLRSYFSDLWALLEYDGGPSLAPPQARPFDDHVAKKFIGNLLKIFASFPGLQAIVGAESMAPAGKESLHYLMNAVLLRKAERIAKGDLLSYHDDAHLVLILCKSEKRALDKLTEFTLLSCRWG